MAELCNTSHSFEEHFSKVSDPREEHKVLYPLQEVLLITVCAVIGGADGWVDIETFGKAKEDFFKKFVPLKNGIPSHDTFGDIFAAINPEEFKECFVNWVKSLQEEIKEIVSIDGKCLRHSYDTAHDRPAIHMVSAWAGKQHLVLGQEKVLEKSNEITAIPKLLEILELSGAIVTIDAIGCQKSIAKNIIDKKADYVLALKGNQGTLHEDVELYFEEQRKCGFADAQHDFYESTDGGHGRVETRKYCITEDIEWLKERHQWAGLRSIGFVESKRETKKKTSIETRYYINSIAANAKQFAEAVRGHWGIENKLHWVLDVNFKEDACRIRTDNAPENFAIVKHMATNLIRQENSKKRSINTKRRLAGWDNEYLLKVITQ